MKKPIRLPMTSFTVFYYVSVNMLILFMWFANELGMWLRAYKAMKETFEKIWQTYFKVSQIETTNYG